MRKYLKELLEDMVDKGKVKVEDIIGVEYKEHIVKREKAKKK